ncbi:RidA family protein [Phyllobacterium sp. SB3]|uniref:RidA family protein n=1 Tax=Phyllobacterium sp. SB3 TaxID=3156073 RepID=UPI0032AEE5DD
MNVQETPLHAHVNPDALALPTGAPDTPFYSWVVKRGNFVFLAGMSPYSKDKKLVGDTLGEQTRQAFRNMTSAIESVGGTIADVCSITIYVQDTDLQKDVYPHINPAVFEVFADRPPARAVVGGVALPRATEKVMISAYAIVDA